MIAAVDVYYTNSGKGRAAAVVFKDFADEDPLRTYTVTINEIREYISGSFYLRELPCLLSLINSINEDIDTFIIDGYVYLGQKPGLGFYLWETLGCRIRVIGVAKSLYKGSECIKLYRGKSRNPLYITSAGIETIEAANLVGGMYGKFRIPALLKLADSLSRK